MPVSFQQIVPTRVPGSRVEFDNSGAAQNAPPRPHVSLLIGQKLTAGTAVAGAPVIVTDPGTQFGYGSILARMCRAYRRIDPNTELYAIPLADAAGAKATSTFTFGGTPTASGAAAVYVCGRRYEVPVTTASTPTTLGAALAVEINDDADCPMTAAAVAGVVTLTDRHFGTVGNARKIGVSLNDGDELPAGLTLAAVQPSSGATDPDFDDAVTGMQGAQYHTVALGISVKTETDKVLNELIARNDAMVQKEGVMYTASVGTQGQVSTYGNLLNSELQIHAGAPVSGLIPTVEELAAAHAARFARQVQSDPSMWPDDSLLGLSGAHRTARFIESEQNTILSDGVCPVGARQDGGAVIVRPVTTYQVNDAGVIDITYSDPRYIHTLHAMRQNINGVFSALIKKRKLSADGPIPPGQPVITPAGGKSVMIQLYGQWRAQSWVDISDDAFKYFVNNLYVTINSTSDGLEIQCHPKIIGILATVGTKISYLI